MKDYEKPSFEVFNFGVDVRTAVCNVSTDTGCKDTTGGNLGGDAGTGGDGWGEAPED